MGLADQLMRTANRAHVALYPRAQGRRFNSVRKLPVVLLTVAGRTSGKERTTPVVHLDHDGGLLVAGSAGGAPTEPQWFRNLAGPRASGVRSVTSPGRLRSR